MIHRSVLFCVLQLHKTCSSGLAAEEQSRRGLSLGNLGGTLPWKFPRGTLLPSERQLPLLFEGKLQMSCQVS